MSQIVGKVQKGGAPNIKSPRFKMWTFFRFVPNVGEDFNGSVEQKISFKGNFKC